MMLTTSMRFSCRSNLWGSVGLDLGLDLGFEPTRAPGIDPIRGGELEFALPVLPPDFGLDEFLFFEGDLAPGTAVRTIKEALRR